MKRLWVSGLLLLAFVCAASLPAAEPKEWRTYNNDTFGYQLQYPAGWTVIEVQPRADGASHQSRNVLSPGVFQKVTFAEPEGALWPGEFVVLVRAHAEGQTLDEWAETNFTDVHDESLVTGARDTTLASRAARQFSVFGFDHTRRVVAFVHDRKIYEISYTGSTPNDPDLAEHGAIHEQMKSSFRLAPSTDESSLDLGGPCDGSEGSSLSNFHAQIRDAIRREDRPQMIDLHKQYVRAMCSNHYRWYGLAQAYLGADRPGMAIQVLSEAHRRGAEIKPSAFRGRANLAKLIETPEFQQSELGHELRELRTVAARRKQFYRAQLEALDVSARPPQRHVAEGACPFECCSYREWEVLETAQLHAAPLGTVVVGLAIKGDKVRGVTGDVHLRPAPVAVVHDHPPFVRGEIIFVLDELGEGFHRYWRNGEIAEEELWFDDVCLRPSRDCWAEQIEDPDDRQAPQWWILIETDEGVRGWTDRSERFGNKDACG